MDDENKPFAYRTWRHFQCDRCQRLIPRGGMKYVTWSPERVASCSRCKSDVVYDYPDSLITWSYLDLGIYEGVLHCEPPQKIRVYADRKFGRRWVAQFSRGRLIARAPSVDLAVGRAEVLIREYVKEVQTGRVRYGVSLEAYHTARVKGLNILSLRPTINVEQWATTKEFDMPAIATPVKKPASVAGKTATSNKAAAPVKEKAPKEPKPEKVRLSATEEELQAAVDGTLQPREIKGDANQASLGEKGENGKSKGRPIGVTTGLPILLAWCYIFQYNEEAKPKDKLTDEQISAWIKSEFPGRETAAFDNVSGCRTAYNKGAYTKGVKPKIQAQRYDENGNVTTARGKSTTEEEAEPAPKPAAAPKASVTKAKASVKPGAPAAKPAVAAKTAVATKPAAVVKGTVVKKVVKT